MALGRGGAAVSWRNGQRSRSKNLVGFRRYPVLQEALANDQGFEGTDEYDPLGDDHSNLRKKRRRCRFFQRTIAGNHTKARIDIQRWTAEERIVAVLTNEPARVAVRILNYPGWRVELWNYETVTPLRLQEPGPMVIPIPAGLSGIRIRFVRTPDQTLGLAMSVIAVLTLLALLNAGGSRLLFASP